MRPYNIGSMRNPVSPRSKAGTSSSKSVGLLSVHAVTAHRKIKRIHIVARIYSGFPRFTEMYEDYYNDVIYYRSCLSITLKPNNQIILLSLLFILTAILNLILNNAPLHHKKGERKCQTVSIESPSWREPALNPGKTRPN